MKSTEPLGATPEPEASGARSRAAPDPELPFAPPRALPAGRPDELLAALARMTGADKHAASASSTLDVLWVLYTRVLDVGPTRIADPRRDRLIVSKGHGPMALYAVLACRGFFPLAWLDTFGDYASPLGHHPSRTIPGVEVSSGSLGHGLPIAVGVALALRALELEGPRVVVLLGDAELDEGSNHEAIAVAARLGLGALTVVVIDNQSATHGWPGGIARRFEAEGWRGVTTDGRDHEAIAAAFEESSAVAHARPARDRPTVIVAVVEPKRAP
jgi:transketolase